MLVGSRDSSGAKTENCFVSFCGVTIIPMMVAQVIVVQSSTILVKIDSRQMRQAAWR
jgi:hypothetical protein